MAAGSSAYLRFLQSPNTSELAPDASINYITTTTTISEPTAILKHIAAQNKQVEKQEEKVLYAIDGDNGCCIETLTTLKFRLGGGAYLPAMDANMLDEREVTFPLTHVVTHADDGKIRQIRLYWDQGTLLKQVEAIGKTGRNWPIRDGKAQIEAVTASVKIGGGQIAQNNGKTTGTRGANDVVIRQHQRAESVSATRDPHASLSLFNERDPNDSGRSYSGPKFEPVKSAKPGPRDYGELFASEETAAALGEKIRSESPHKSDGTVLKAGAGKNFSGNRLFDDNDPNSVQKSPIRKKTYSQKYDHFIFDDGEGGDGEDRPAQEPRPVSGKGGKGHKSNFSFEDFSTPPKHIEKHKPDYERHWGADVDEDAPESPPNRPIVHAARKDAEPHFEMTDDSPAPAPEKQKSLQRQKGVGLYRDPLVDDERVTTGHSAQRPSQTTNVNNNRRGDDFGAHYALADDSPAGSKVTQDKRSTRSELATNWGFESPPVKPQKIYKTAGDGMGSRSGGRSWGIGDESDPEVDTAVRPSARSRRNQAQAGADELDF